MENALKRFWEANRRVIVICLIATFVWGLAAHGYHFLNFQLNHDCIDGIYAAGLDSNNDHKIELGRVFVPAYRYLTRGMMTLPWMLGFLGLVWTGLAVFCVAALFEIRSPWLLILLSGVMTTNLAVTSQAATYLNDYDANMFALMISCFAALAWRKKLPGWVVLGAAAVGLGIGLYQSYVSVTIALVMIVMILRLLDGEKMHKVLLDGIKAAGMTILGAGVYYAGLKTIPTVTGIPLVERSNSISQLANMKIDEIPMMVRGAYFDWLDFFTVPDSAWLSPQVMQVVNVALLVLTTLLLIAACFSKKVDVKAKGLAVILFALLPLGMNVCYVLTSGTVHDLMKYAFVLIFVLALMLTVRVNFKPVRWLCGALVFMTVWSGTQTANTIYLKKTAVWNATYAHMTNVVYDMLYYGYVPGETEVFISGQIPFGDMPGFENVEGVVGVDHNNAITRDQKSIRSYFQYVFGDKMVFATEEQQEAIMATEDFEYMSRWPDEGYITIVDDVMVVKLN
ncbi:MAG: glucosyltransferase domain-containing protein [Clostridia bacterium]|nr:glucosyltransferase domain-containing protein [Clostridia bacterium]